MIEKLGGRKWILVTYTVLTSTILALLSIIPGGSWVNLMMFSIGIYTAGNVGSKFAATKPTTKRKR